MKIEEALKLEKESFERRIEIRKRKGQDYATDENILGNFKRMSIILGELEIDPSTSYGIALIYAVLKIDRLCNLVFRQKKKEAINEPIKDTIDDLKNYIDLFDECLIEEKIYIT